MLKIIKILAHYFPEFGLEGLRLTLSAESIPY